jgi:cytochrome c-type biogenesis protein CcsB
MKSIVSFISSFRTMAVLLLLFAFSIGAATFIEKTAGTEAARAIIYNAAWFELLLIFGAIHIIAVTIKKKLYRKEKITILVFHWAFVIILLGAALTRYYGKEGIMTIREGETTNKWYTQQPYIHINLTNQNGVETYTYPVHVNGSMNIRFRHHYVINNHEVSLKINEYIPRAEKTIIPDPDGQPCIQVVTFTGNEKAASFLTLGDSMMVDSIPMVLVATSVPDFSRRIAVFVNEVGGLSFEAPFNVTKTSMRDGSVQVLKAGEACDMIPGMIYNFHATSLVLTQFTENGLLVASPARDPESAAQAALNMSVSCDQVTRYVTVWEQGSKAGLFSETSMNPVKVGIAFGPRTEELPFSITLDDFILKRYPGSESPSWFESDVRLADPARNLREKYRIYVNHILKYGGYRFYQSSFDADEKGTVLSVNNDRIGTSVTYAGYILLFLGILASLLNKKSRFRMLIRKPSPMKGVVPVLALGMLFAISTPSVAGTNREGSSQSLPVIDKNHAREFGRLLIQVNNGRIVPVNTLSSEILRKISRKETYKGQNSDQVLLGMLVFPGPWEDEPVIRVSNPRLRQVLGIHQVFASYSDFFSPGEGYYLLKDYVEDAYRKKPLSRNKFDNEVIKADERLNVCYMIFSKDILKILPGKDSITHKWYAPNASSTYFRAEDTLLTGHIVDFYLAEVERSVQSHRWSNPSSVLKSISDYQKRRDAAVMPSDGHIRAEILYNRLNIFNRLIHPYMLIGFILLLIQFIHIFMPRFSIRYFSGTGIGLLMALFAFHTIGLALRWYVSGHAPITNGYETLSFIAWAAVLAGLLLAYKSPVTISTTSILAGLILQIAQLSWMDPQITNLVPVLRSVWLVIHVAVVTASYGFLGMGTLLAIFNLLLMIFETARNQERLEIQINQITQIIEITLIAGLYLLTIGSFLGGVWANESWGRYWGWDPKETWALVSILVYAFVTHMHLIPGLKGRLLFNIFALISISSVLMTYFGVNYYLTGLHSYASGEAMPLPPALYYSLQAVMLLIVLSSAKQWYLRRKGILKAVHDE